MPAGAYRNVFSDRLERIMLWIGSYIQVGMSGYCVVTGHKRCVLPLAIL